MSIIAVPLAPPMEAHCLTIRVTILGTIPTVSSPACFWYSA